MKNNKIIQIIACTLLCFGMQGCNSDDGTDIGNAPVAVQFASSVDNVAQQRIAIDGDKWTAGDKIGIFMLNENATLASANIVGGADNKPYEAQIGNNATSSFIPVGGTPIYYPIDGKVDFVAYYPYTTPLTNYKLAVNVSDQSDPSKIDVLYSNNATAKDKNSGTVDLQFVHALSKLSFTLKQGTGNPDLANAKIEISNLETTADINLATGLVENLGPEATITAHRDATAIVLPQSTSTSKLTVTLADGNKFECDFSNKKFEQGKDYGYTITVSKTGITVSTGAITLWEGTGDTPTEGDTAIRYKVGDYYPDPDVDLTNAEEKAKIQGIVYWLKDPADGKSRHGKIVSLDETSKTWDEAKDWCAAKGTSWSLPTKEELKALYAGYSGKRYEDITDWDDFEVMQGYDATACQDARTAFNTKLTTASGAEFTSAWYWSSSEHDVDYAWVVSFSGGSTGYYTKATDVRVRAVSAF